MKRVAVVGCGAFGQNHLRVIAQSGRAKLAAAVDINGERAERAGGEWGCAALRDWRELEGLADAAVVATPTSTHAEIGCGLMEAGLDVLVEKPIAGGVVEARRLQATAEGRGRVLQVGHLERFNPAIVAVAPLVKLPLFFEVHRLSVFSPRSLDVDVILDLMIHDLDLVVKFAGARPVEVSAAGIRILSEKVDIASVRLQFPNGSIANLTASRVSTEKVRKLRLFQPGEYISVDYARQDGLVIRVGQDRKLQFEPMRGDGREPLAAQLEAFLDALDGAAPAVPANEAVRVLEVAVEVMEKIEDHGRVVARTLAEAARSG